MASPNKYKFFYASLMLTFGVTFSHCAHSNSVDSNDQFVARDGDLFPEYIYAFFSGAKLFNSYFPQINIARKDVIVVEVKRLTEVDENFNEANLTWSNNGALLGYEIITEKNRKIMLKNMIGNYSRELLVLPNKSNQFLDGLLKKSIHSYNASLRWANDNKKFAFMSNGGQGNYSIYLGNISSGVAPIADSPMKDGYPIWSPEGNDLVFVSARSGQGDIYEINLTSNRIQQLTFSEATDLFPEWTPDGKKIVYSSGEARQHNLHIVEKTESDSWNTPRVLLESEFDCLRPTISPNGKLIAFYSNYGSSDQSWSIHILDMSLDPDLERENSSGKNNIKFTAKNLRDSIVARNVVVDINTGPTWTPDGKKILYVDNDPKHFNPIYMYDLKEGQRYVLQTNTRMNRDIQISKAGVLSFRAQVGSWERVFVALTNQGAQLQGNSSLAYRVVYPGSKKATKGSLL